LFTQHHDGLVKGTLATRSSIKTKTLVQFHIFRRGSTVVPLLALTFISGGVKLAGEIWIRGLTSIFYDKLFILNALNKPNSPTASVSVLCYSWSG